MANIATAEVNDLLYNADHLRTLVGILVERLGGRVMITAADLSNSPSAAGQCELYVELETNECADLSVTLAVKPLN